MSNIKFEIILSYYKRPKMVLNALESIKNSYYKNWHLTLIDDSGDDSFKEDFFKFGFKKDKVDYIAVMMPDEEKIKLGGSMFGKYINDVIENTDADVIIPLCDDDALLPDYMSNLNTFYTKNPNSMWAYCHLKYYNPQYESYKLAKSTPDNPNLNFPHMNANTTPINPYCRVDSSQVTFRTDALLDGDIRYAYPQTANLDADIYSKFFKKHGNCDFMGTIGQCKGWFDGQLGVKNRQGKNGFITD